MANIIPFDGEISSSGYRKINQDDNSILLAGGGHKAVSQLVQTENDQSIEGVKTFNDIMSASGIFSIEGNVIRVPNPKGGSSGNLGNSNSVGAIKIRLPKKASTTMLSFVVDIYDYVNNRSVSLFISGYDHTSQWISTTVKILSENSSQDYNVRFGHDGTYSCVWIGELSTAWQYPKVIVRDFLGGFSNINSGWAENWQISRVTSFDTVQTTKTGNLVASDFNKLKNISATSTQLLLGSGAGINQNTFATAAQGELADNSVQLTGNETIQGIKTFSDITQFNSSTTQRLVDSTSTTNHFRKYENVAAYSNSTSSVSGKLRIELPVTTSTMWNMKVVILEFEGNFASSTKTTTLTINGYSGSNNNNCSVICDNPDRITGVEWGRNTANDKTVILITPISTFRYPKALVSEVYTHHSHSSLFEDPANYSITITTDETDFSLQSTILNDGFLRDSFYAEKAQLEQEYLENSYTDVNMDTYDTNKSLLLGRNIGGWSSGTKPAGTHNGFGILHVTTHEGGYATQFGFDTNQNKIWLRSRNPTSWGSWRYMWTDQDFSQTNINNWNTAYGWGNHAGLYATNSHSHTFASLTSKPTTISGYGITDLSFALYKGSNSADWNAISYQNGIYRLTGNTNNPFGVHSTLLSIGQETGQSYGFQLAHGTAGNKLQFRGFAAAGSFSPWYELYHDGNLDPANFATSAQGVLADNSVQLTGEANQTIEGNVNIDGTLYADAIRVERLAGIEFANGGIPGSYIRTGTDNTIIIGTRLPSAPYTEVKTIFVNTNGKTGFKKSLPDYEIDVFGEGRFTGDLRCLSLIQTSQTNKKKEIATIKRTKAGTMLFKSFKYIESLDPSGSLRYGVLAEDIEKDYPELVYTDVDGVKGVNYIDLLLKRVAELEQELEDAKKSMGRGGLTINQTVVVDNKGTTKVLRFVDGLLQEPESTKK